MEISREYKEPLSEEQKNEHKKVGKTGKTYVRWCKRPGDQPNTTNLNRLDARIRMAIRLRARGMMHPEIAEATGLSLQQIRRALSPKGWAFKALEKERKRVERVEAGMTDDVLEAIKTRSIGVVDRLFELCESEDEKLALEAVNSWLDRAGLARVSQSNNTSVIAHIGKEDRSAMYERIMQNLDAKRGLQLAAPKQEADAIEVEALDVKQASSV